MTTDLHPEGRFPAVLRSIQFNTAKSSGNRQAALGFEIHEAQQDEAGERVLVSSGRFLTYFGSFSEAAVDHTIKALRNCGWEGDDLAELPDLAEAGQLGNEVALVVKHEEYEGEWSAKVKWVNTPSGGGKIKLERVLDERELTSFAQQMKSRVRAAGGARPSNGTRKPQGAPPRDVPPPGDSDIPFCSSSIGHEPSDVAPVLRRRV